MIGMETERRKSLLAAIKRAISQLDHQDARRALATLRGALQDEREAEEEEGDRMAGDRWDAQE